LSGAAEHGRQRRQRRIDASNDREMELAKEKGDANAPPGDTPDSILKLIRQWSNS
jgi:hypothetical protein